MSSNDYITMLVRQTDTDEIFISKIPDKKIKQAYLTNVTNNTWDNDIIDDGISIQVVPGPGRVVSYAYTPDTSIIVMYFYEFNLADHSLWVSINQRPAVAINPGALADAIALGNANADFGLEHVTRVMFAEDKFYFFLGHETGELITLWTSSDGLEWAYQGLTDLRFAYD
jgi:hypothetical protein